MIIFIMIFLCLFIILLFINCDNHRQIKELLSILEYYKWHDGFYDLPTKTSWYLVQTEDKIQKIKVSFYDVGKQKWLDDIYIKAWCHLPNLLYRE